MSKNLQYVLVVIIVLAILYLLYKNSSESYNSESYNSCNQQPDKSNIDVDKSKSVSTSYDTSKDVSAKSKTLVVYYTTWCGYSKRFLQQLKSDLEHKLNKIGVTVELVDCQEPEKCIGIKGYPTLILYTNKGKTVYQGDRSEENLIAFCLQH